ncbi:hypothetical protein ACLK10_04950 [Escherichia coli]
MSRCNNQYSRSSRIMHLQLNNLRNSRITPLRRNNPWQECRQAEEQHSTFAPQSTYQTEQTYQQPAAQEPLYQQPQSVEQQPVVEPEPVVEETKPARPPLYYFEEVEEKRAREREQLRPGINRFQNRLKNQNRSNLR